MSLKTIELVSRENWPSKVCGDDSIARAGKYICAVRKRFLSLRRQRG